MIIETREIRRLIREERAESIIGKRGINSQRVKRSIFRGKKGIKKGGYKI